MNKDTANALGVAIGCLLFFAITYPLPLLQKLFWLFVIVIALVGIALIIQIWRINPNSDGVKIINLVNRANKGDLGAQAECDDEPFVKKKMVYRKGVPCTLYEVAPEVCGWL